jgi:hypothetical protein
MRAFVVAALALALCSCSHDLYSVHPELKAMDDEMRFLRFMSFPNVQDVEGYRALLAGAGCTVMTAENTRRSAPYVDLYLEMVDKQLTYDALRILDFNADALGAIAA